MINPWELRKQLVRPDLFALLTDISESGIVVVYNALNLINEFEIMTDILMGTVNMSGIDILVVNKDLSIELIIFNIYF